MALSFVGFGFANSANPPTPSGARKGDLVCVVAHRTASATAPAVPAGWSQINIRSTLPALVAAWAIWDGNAIPTFSNATSCQTMAWTGYEVGSAYGGSAVGGATSTTITFPAVTLVRTNSTSHLVRAVGDERPDVAFPVPAGHTTIRNSAAADRPAYASFRIGPVTTAAAVSVTVSRSSAYSAISFEIKAAPTAPASSPTPTFSNVGFDTLTVNWSAPPGTAERVTVQRATASGGPWTDVADLAAADLSFDDSGLNGTTTYWYRIVSVNGAGSFNGTAASTTTTGPPSKTVAPGGIDSAQAFGSANVAPNWPQYTAIIDSFDRSDENPLAGGIWGQAIGFANPNGLSIVANEVKPGGDATTLASFGPDLDAVAFTTSSVPAAGEQIYLFARLQNANASNWSGYFIHWVKDTDAWEIVRHNADGSEVQLTTGTKFVVPGSMLGIGLRGSVITAYYCPSPGSFWQIVAFATDSSPITSAGKLGLSFLSPNSSAVGIHEFTGGPVLANTTLSPGGIASAESFGTASVAPPGAAAFPTVVGTQTSNDAGNQTVHPVTYPTVSGGILADDLLVVFFGIDEAAAGTVITDWGGFTELGWGDVSGNTSAGGVAYKWAAGGETGTFSVTSSVTERATSIVHVIRGADRSQAPVISAATTGTTANPDPPSLTPPWGSSKTLWFAFLINDQLIATAAPTNYTNLITNFFTSATAVSVAQREAEVATEDPAAFTVAAEQWRAYTLAIKPAAGGGIPSKTVSSSGLASAEAFGAPTIPPPTKTLVGSGIASAQAFGSNSVLAGPWTISSVGGIASAEAFGTGSVTPPVWVTGITTAEVQAANGTPAITLPSDVRVGDQLYCLVNVILGSTDPGVGALPTPSGWELVFTDTYGSLGGGWFGRAYIFRKIVAGAVSAPTLTVSGASGNGPIQAMMVNVRGADPLNPVETSPFVFKSSGTNNLIQVHRTVRPNVMALRIMFADATSTTATHDISTAVNDKTLFKTVAGGGAALSGHLLFATTQHPTPAPEANPVSTFGSTVNYVSIGIPVNPLGGSWTIVPIQGINSAQQFGSLRAKRSGNYLTLDSSSTFETTAAGWSTASDAGYTALSAARSTLWAETGVGSLRVAGTHPANTTSLQFGAGQVNQVAVADPGDRLVAKAVFNVITAASQGVRIAIEWLDSASTVLSKTTGPLLLPGQTGRVVAMLDGTAPANSFRARVRLEGVSNVSGEASAFYVDDIFLGAGGVFSLSGIPSAEAFGSDVVTVPAPPTPITTTGSIASAEGFGTPTLSQIKAFAPNGIPSAEAFGTAVVNRTLPVGSIASAEAFGTTRVSFSLRTTGIASSESFGTLSISKRYSVNTAGIPSGESFGTQRLISSNRISLSSISSAEAVGTFTISSHNVVYSVGIPSSEAFGFQWTHGPILVVRRAVGTTDAVVVEPAYRVVDSPVTSTEAIELTTFSTASIREPLEEAVDLLSVRDAVVVEPKETIDHNVDSVTAVIDLHANTDAKEM